MERYTIETKVKKGNIEITINKIFGKYGISYYVYSSVKRGKYWFNLKPSKEFKQLSKALIYSQECLK